MSGFLRKICVFLVFVVACFAGVHAANGYTYTLNDDGAKVASVPHSFTIGSVTQLSSLPYKPGYGYGGHYTGQHCQGTQIIDYTGTIGVSLNANTTLYACWRPMNSYWMSPIIVLDDDGGAGGAFGTQCGTAVSIARVSGEYVSYGGRGDWAHLGAIRSEVWWESACFANPVSPLTAMAQIPTRQGFIFRGYYTGPNGSGTQVVYENGNLVDVSAIPSGALSSVSPTTIYAYWTSNTPTWATVTINDQNATTSSQYSVLYININGSVSNCFGYRTGQSCTALNVTSFTPPTKTGYTYGGHYTQTNGGGSQWANSSGVIQYSVQDSRTVYAQWTPNVYTVTLNHGSPTNSPAPSTVYLKYGTGWYSNSGATTPIYAMTTVPQKTNYTFGGYWTGQNGTGTRVIDSDGKFLYTTAALTALTSNATIYAYWTAATQNPTWITVTFDDNSPTNYSQYNGGRLRYLYRNTNSAISNCSGYKLSQSCNATTVTHFTPPTKSGYTYGGHYTGSTQWSDASGNILVNLSANTTVTAQWTQNSGTIYTVTLYPNGGTGSNLLIYERQNIGWYRDSGGTYQITSSIFNSTSSGGAGLTQPTYTNHVFNGYWTGKTADGATSCSGTQMIDANGNILASPSYDASQRWYACWVGQQSTVTLNANGGTACATTQVTATYGSPMPALSCAPTAPTGHHFNGYFDATSGGTQYYYADLSSARNWDKTGAQTLYAQWVANTYTVKYYCDKEEYELGTPSATDNATYGQSYVVKTRAAVGCTPPAGAYKFMGWSYGSSEDVWQPGEIITYNFTEDKDAMGWYMEIETVTLNHGSPDNSPGPNTVYFVHYDGWYTDSNATMEATVSPVPVKYGYDFLGYWTTATSGGIQIVNSNGQFITTDVNAPATIYARYGEKIYQIALDDQNATTAGAPTPLYYSISNGWSATSGGTTITQITTAPTKTGYAFNGYWTQTGGTGTKIINADRTFATVTSAILQAMHDGTIDTLYADWLVVNTVTFSCQNQAGDGSGTPSPATVQVADGETLTFPSLANCSWGNAGYSPYLWGYVVNGSFVETHEPGDTITWDSGWGNRTFNVWYAPNYFNYEYSCGAGSGTPPASGNTYYHNGGWTTAANTCTPPANKHFTGWLEPVSNEVWAESTVPTNGYRWPYDVTAAAGGAFVAQYADDTYTATFTCENNIYSPYVFSGTAPESITNISYNQTITLPSPSVCTNNYPDAGWIVSPATQWSYNCVDGNGGAAGNGSAVGSTSWPAHGNCTFRPMALMSSYDITYDCNGGTGNAPAADTVNYTNRNTARPAANTCTAPTGHHFTGWQVGTTSTVLQPGQYGGSNALWPYTQNITLRAQWEADTYNLTWGCGDGTGTPSGASYPTTIDYGETLTFPANTACTAPTGHTFGGWAVDVNTTTYQPNGTLTWNYTSGSEINAVFNPIKVNITYSCGTGASGTAPAAQNNIDYGSQVTLRTLGNCAMTGFYATRWLVSNTSPTDNYEFGATVDHWNYTENKNLVPNWTAQSYNIIYKDEDGETVLTGLTPSSYTYGTSTTINAVPTKLHSTFNGWCTTRNATTGVLSGCQPTTTPHVIGPTETGEKIFYASWSCDTGYQKYRYDREVYQEFNQSPILYVAGSCAPGEYEITCHENCDGDTCVACIEQLWKENNTPVHLGQRYGVYDEGWESDVFRIHVTGGLVAVLPDWTSHIENFAGCDSARVSEYGPNYCSFVGAFNDDKGQISLSGDGSSLPSFSVFSQNDYVAYIESLASIKGVTPWRQHYTFDGLWTAAEGGQRYLPNTNGTTPWYGFNSATETVTKFFTSDADVYAHWIPDVYMVSLEANGGNPGTLTAVYEEYGNGWSRSSLGPFGAWTQITGNELPTKSGYTFAGYYDTSAATGGTQYVNANGTLANGISATSIGQETALYARWTPNCNAVILYPGEGTAGSTAALYKKTGVATLYTDSNCSTQYTTSSNVIPSRDGWTFRGFHVTQYADVTSDNAAKTDQVLNISGAATTYNSSWTISNDVTLYAAWAKDCTVPSNGTCVLDVTTAGAVDYTTTCSTGYTLGGNNTATPTCSANCNAVTLNPNGGTAGTRTVLYKKSGVKTWYIDNTCETAYGSSHYSSIVPSYSGYKLRGFYTSQLSPISASSSSPSTRYMQHTGATTNTGTNWLIYEPKTLYAAWAEDCVAPAHGTCNVTVSGATTTYSASCDDGYTVSGATTSTPSCTANTITINWDENGGGAVSNGSCTYDANLGLSSTYTPTYANHVFNGWKFADGTYHSAGEIVIGGCVEGNLGVTSGTSTAIQAQWCHVCAAGSHAHCSLDATTTPGTCAYTTYCDDGYTISGNGTATPTCSATGYTVTYKKGSGTGSDVTQNVAFNSNFTTKDGTQFTKTNSVVTSWTTTSGGSYPNLNTQYTYSTAGNTVLTANWGACACTKGTNVADCDVTGVTDNTCQYSYTCTPGYNNGGAASGTFSGAANTASNTSPNCASTNTYTITYKNGGGTGSDVTQSGISYMGSFTTKPGTIFTKTNSIIKSWNTVSGGTYPLLNNTYTEYDTAGNTVLAANWATCGCTPGTGVATCTTSATASNTCSATVTCASGFDQGSATWSCVDENCSSSCSADDYEITLDNANATTNGTAKIYTTYGAHVYLNPERSQIMATSGSNAYPITVPSRVYTVTYDGNSGTVGTTSATNTTATYTFKGYYSAASGGTQYIVGSTGRITQDGINAGIGYTANATWNAQWTSASVTLPNATRAGYVLKGWYNATTGGTKVGDAGGTYTPTANITLHAQWTKCSAGNYCPGDNTSVSCSTATNGKYPNSAAGATSINDCYLTLTPGNYVATAGAGAVQCVANSYCDSTANIYYGGTHSASHMTTGGSTACSTGAASSYSSSAAGSDANTDCYKTVTLNKNGGSGTIQGTTGTNPASITCYFNTSCDFGSASGLAQTGYTFTGGWGTSASCSGTTTSYTVPNNTDTYYACKSTNCNAITFNTTQNGGSGNQTTLYKPSNSTNWYTNAACSTPATNPMTVVATKDNATFGGYYTGNAATGGTQVVTASGALSSSWTVTEPTELTAQYDCDTGWQETGIRIAGACVADVYDIEYELNGGMAVLNDDYTPIEYIASNGSTYLNLGFKTKDTMRVESVFKRTGTSSSEALFGNYSDGASGYTFAFYPANSSSNAYAYYASTSSVSMGIKLNTTDWHSVVFDGFAHKVKVNNTTKALSAIKTFTSAHNMPLFGRYYSSYGYFTTGQVKSFTVYDSGVMYYNGVPVINNQTGACGLYDTVNGGFVTGTSIVNCPTVNVLPQSYTYNIGATVSGVPVRANSTFAGWCTDSGLSSCNTTQTVSTSATGTQKFYAKWTCNTGYTANAAGTACVANTYTVSFNSNGGTGGQSANVTATYGSAMPAISTTKPVRTGYTFMGWYDNATYTSGKQYYSDAGASVSAWDKTAATTLYAGWKADCNKITFNTTQNGGSGTQTALYKKTNGTAWYSDSSCGTTATNPMTVVATKDNATFGGYYTGNAATGGTQVVTAPGALSSSWTVTGATTVYAQYDCDTGWQEAGIRIAGACVGTISADANDVTKVYDGTSLTCAGVTNVLPDGATVAYRTAASGSYNLTEAPSITNVADSTTVYYQISATGYQTITGQFTCSITPADCTITMDPVGNISTVYPTTTTFSATTSSGGNLSVSPTSGSSNVAIASISNGTVTVTPQSTGTQTITVTSASTGNYNSCTATKQVSVTNGTITADVNDVTKVYDGTPLTCSGVTNVVPSGAEVRYRTTASGSYNLTEAPSITNVADSKDIYYQITADNYTTATGSFNCSVTKADCSITVKEKITTPLRPSSVVTLVYPLSKTLTATSSCGGTVTITSGNTSYVTVSNGKTLNPVKVTSSDITMTASVPASANYNAASATFKARVNRGTCTITLDPTSGTITYPTTSTSFDIDWGRCNGTKSVSSSATGVATAALNSGNGSATVTYQSAGAATITVSSAQSDQYNAASATYSVTTVNGDIVYSAGDKTLTYTGSAQSCGNVSVTSPSGTAISYALKSGNSCGAYSSTAPTMTNVSESPKTICYKIEKADYTTVSGEYACTMQKATMSPVPSDNSKTYDGTSLNCNGDTWSGVPSGSTKYYSTTNGSGYSETVPSITNVADSKTIYYKITNPNYNDFTGDFECEITPATMTVTANDKTLTYNGTTTTNGTNQSCANVTVTTPASGSTVTYAIQTNGTCGQYGSAPTLRYVNDGPKTICYKVEATNYTTATGTYTCTMNPKNMTVSAPIKKLSYNGSAQSCANVTVSDPSSGASVTYSASSNGTYTSNAPTLTNGGSTTVYYKVTGANYNNATGSYLCTMNQVTLNPTTSELPYSGTGTFTATCNGGGTISVTSDGNSTASINTGTGVVTVMASSTYEVAHITVNCAAAGDYVATSTTHTVTVDLGNITLNDAQNGGMGGSGTIYTKYNTNVYTDSDRQSIMTTSANNVTIPTKTKAVFTGYYNSASGTNQYIDNAGYITDGTNGGIAAGRALNQNGTWYAKFEDCTCDTSDVGVATCVAKQVTNNQCVYDVTFNAGYTGDAVQTNPIAGVGAYTAVSGAGIYTITLRNYNNTATHSTIYEKYNDGWYSNSTATTPLAAATIPSRTGYKFRGFYTAQQADLTESGGTGTRRITNATTNNLPANTTFTANTSLYAAWAKDCTSPAHGTCSVDINNDGTATYSASCDTGYTVSGATTATPTCAANTYSISYTLNGGAYGNSHPTGATYDVQFTVNNPTHDNATFAGWTITGMDSGVTHYYGNQTTTGTSITTPTTATTFKNLRSTDGTVTFTATWTCDPGYTGDNCTPVCNAITVDNTTRGGSTANTTLYKKSGDTKWFSDNSCQTQVTTTPAPSKTNATFAGYYLAPDNVLSPVGSDASPSVLSTTWTVTAPATIYAHYNCDTHYTQGGTDIAGACNPDVYDINYEFNGGSALPAGYTRVEYIQGNGSSYIDTDVYFDFSKNYEVIGNVINVDASTRNIILGSYKDTNTNAVSFEFGGSSNSQPGKFRLWAGLPSVTKFSNSALPVNTTVHYNGVYNANSHQLAATLTYGTSSQVVSINTSSISGVTSYPLRFFIDHRSSNSVIANPIKIGFHQIYKDGELIRQYIPVRYNNVCGMYESVTGVFLPSATGTAFTCPNTAYTGDYPTEYTYGVGADITGVPTRAHSQFVGWCTNIGLTNNCVTPQSVSTTDYDDKTFYAKWSCDTGYTENAAGTVCEANTLTIKLNKNGGTGTCGGAGGTTEGTLTCTYDGACTAPSWNATTCNINNGSKIFTGWNMQSNGGGISYAPGASIQNIISSGTTRLYAMWSDVTCDITNGGGTASNTTTNTPTCAVTCDTGYGTSGTYTGTAGTTTVSYTCAATDYTMQYLCSDGEAGWNFAGTAPTATNPVHYGDNVTLAADPYNSQTGCRKIWNVQGEYCDNCFTFGGWTIDAESAALEDPDLTHAANSSVSPWGNTGGTDWCIVNTTGVCSAYSADDTFLVRPQYTPKQYDITYMYATSPVDNNASMPADYTYTVGTSISNADQTPPAHATFSGWCTGVNGTGTCYNAGLSIAIGNRAHGDITYYANWSCDTGYTLTYDANNQPVCSADAITCPATQYLPANATTCVDCTAGNYCPGGSFTFNETTVQGIYVCATNTYSNNVASACTACATANGYTNSGSTAADHAYESSCKTTCSAGQCVATARAACANVGVGGWATGGVVSQGSTLACNACPTGLTTIGYGTGADEADDCGRVLHLGENHMYLRGASKTNPSLHVKVGDTVFYGNMSTSLKNMSDNINKKLRLKYNDTTYSVYDDSVAD